MQGRMREKKIEGQEDISFDFYIGCGLDGFLLQRRIIIYLSTTKYIFLIEIQYHADIYFLVWRRNINFTYKISFLFSKLSRIKRYLVAWKNTEAIENCKYLSCKNLKRYSNVL